jgi:dTDP-4-dehydrorhamnose 3,5-epimerase
MQITDTKIPAVKHIVPKKHGDTRGYFMETFSEPRFAEAGIRERWVQDNQSLSVPRGTVRGLHFQIAPAGQAKLIRVLQGAILDVAVDLRHGSPTYGQHVAVELTADGGEQLYVPVGFAHGFCTLVPDTVVAYKVSHVYAPLEDRGLRWNDPALGIDWPMTTETAVLSPKDTTQPLLADLPAYFTLA